MMKHRFSECIKLDESLSCQIKEFEKYSGVTTVLVQSHLCYSVFAITICLLVMYAAHLHFLMEINNH